MFGYVKESKYKELEEKYEHMHNFWKAINAESDEIMVQQSQTIAELRQELEYAKATTFPDTKFNIGKAVALLNTKLSDKALAKFAYEWVEDLSKNKMSHLVSLNNYVLKFLSK